MTYEKPDEKINLLIKETRRRNRHALEQAILDWWNRNPQVQQEIHRDAAGKL